MSLQKLAEMSNRYGSNPECVLAGGGNTSYKDENYLYVKGSGTSLATIKPEEFVMMERKGLAEMMTKTYPEEDALRESMALEDLMASRHITHMSRRPSVETSLHDLFPYSYVLHLHPSMINGMTCGKEGASYCEKLFGGKAVWIPITKPGYILAKVCKEAMDKFAEKNGFAPKILFLENHGVFFAADTVEEIDELCAGTFATLKGQVKEEPDFSEVEFDRERAAYLAPTVRMLYNANGGITIFHASKSANEFVVSKDAFEPLSKPFSPDHIVYCKAYFLFVEACEDADAQTEALKKAFAEYVEKNGFAPRIIAVEKLGYFIAGDNMKQAQTAEELLIDSVKVAVYAKAFGGALHMTQELIDFIVNWEVESYRSKVSAAGASAKRLEGKISLVTGSAQGFGKGIAVAMAEHGAHLVIADLNYDGAVACADEINAKYGANTAFAIKVNVGDEASVKEMFEATALTFGGIDVLVNNAGIVRAGSLDEMTKDNFEFVTLINYTAYYLCAKYASKMMKIQNRVAPDYLTDIIQINSKSGLAGSNKNFAYAGSKFGGIGLTQSFALELAPYQIKVNAICPGNLLDGPLWSDPEKGLFVQYLNAGKVPGAKTVADVKKFYESKVPMNRGCREEDVVVAILYLIEQKYETGQAIPVTGGQEMLK